MATATFLLSLPVREPSTWEWSRRSVRPMPIGHGSLRLVDPAAHPGALPSVCIPIARPFLIHLPGALRSTGITRLHRSYGSSDSCQAGAWCLASLIASWTEPSTRSVSRHPPSSRSLGLHSTNACAAESGFLETNPPTEQGNTGVLWLHHGTVGSPERKTESSSSPTDRSFTSWCSPPPSHEDAGPLGYDGQAGRRQELSPC